MNIIDFILLLPLMYAFYLGYTKGFIIQIASLIALLLGVWGALKFSEFTAAYLQKQVDFSPSVTYWVAFFITFMLILLGVILLARLLDKTLSLTALGIVNRLLGAVISVSMWVLIISFMIYLFNPFNKKFDWISKNTLNESFLYPRIAVAAPKALPYFDAEQIHQVYQQVEKKVKNTTQTAK